jgi:thiol:disulfide interchange protein DsbA
MLRALAFLFIATASVAAVAAGTTEFEEGVNYHWVSPTPASTENIEALEFFWYGCPHCYSFEPYVKKWQETKPDGVDFAKVPATFNRPEVMMHARTFYALEAIGAPAQVHEDIMSEMHDRKNRLADQGAMEAFLQSRGVDVDAWRTAMESFSVHLKVQQAAQMAQKYGITGVPALVVDGQYRSGDVKSYDHMVSLLDFLVEEARQARGR